MTMDRTTNRRLLFLMLICAALRLAHIVFEYNPEKTSSWESAEIARNVVNGDGYSMKLPWGPKSMLTAHMPPGVVYLLAGLYKTGVPHPHFWFLILNLIAATATLPIIFSIARMAFSPRAGWLAAILYLVDLNLSFTVTWVQETALNVFFTTAGIWAVCRAVYLWQSREPQTLSDAATDLAGIPKSTRRADFYLADLAGICFGLGALIRPVILMTATLAMLWLLSRKQVPFIARLRFAVTTTFLTIVLIAPWTVRNYAVFKQFIPICQNWAINVWLGYSEGAGGSQWNREGKLHLPTGTLAKQLASLDEERQIDEVLTQDAWNYTKKNPWSALMLRPKCFLYFWLDHNYWIDPMPIPVSSKIRIANYILVGLTFFSMLVYWRSQGIPRLLLIVMVCTAIFYTVFHADAGNRFRMQIEPIMLIFIAQLAARFLSLIGLGPKVADSPPPT